MTDARIAKFQKQRSDLIVLRTECADNLASGEDNDFARYAQGAFDAVNSAIELTEHAIQALGGGTEGFENIFDDERTFASE